MMPTLFSLALKPALDQIQAFLQDDEWVVAIYVVATAARTRQIIDHVAQVLLATCNIEINRSKLECWSPTVQPAPDDICCLQPQDQDPIWKADLPPQDCGIKIVGTPIGNDAYIQAFGSNLVHREEQLPQYVPQLSRLHSSWLMLLYCAVPRINHLLRTLRPEQAHYAASMHAQRIITCLFQLLEINAGRFDAGIHRIAFTLVQRQSQFPIRLAGLGLRNSARTSLAAYWASWSDCLPSLHARFPHIIQLCLHHFYTFDEDRIPDGAHISLVAAKRARNIISHLGSFHASHGIASF